jgi:hypothetical protein
MNPTASDLYVDALLTELLVSYGDQPDLDLAPGVFPRVRVQQPSGLYGAIDRGDWNRIEAEARAPGAESAGGGYRFNRQTFQTTVYSLHKDNDAQTQAADPIGVASDQRAGRYVVQNLKLLRNQLWVANYFVPGVWTTQWAGVAAGPVANQFLRWDVANSDPVRDVDNIRLAMAALTGGFKPNVMVIGPQVLPAIKANAAINNRFQYVQGGILTPALMASLFEMDNVYVPYVVNTTSAEGAANTFNFMFGKSVWLGYAAPDAGMDVASAGYTFTWDAYMGMMGPDLIRLKNLPMPLRDSNRIEGDMAFGFGVVAPDLGALLTAVVA